MNYKGIRIPQFVKFLLVESEAGNFFLEDSRILGFGIRNTAQGIQNHYKRLESGIQVPQRGIQNPRRSWIPLRGANGSIESFLSSVVYCVAI